MREHTMRRCALVWLVGLLCAVAFGRAGAHDIPGDARIHAFVKPEGEVLRVALRVPLELLLNLDLPKRGPGYLDLVHVEGRLGQAVAAAVKDIVFLEDGRTLVPARTQARIALPSDRSFESFDKAVASIQGPKLPPETDVFWNQGYFDAYLEYPAQAGGDYAVDFHVSPGLRDRLRLDLRYVRPDGTVRAFEIPTASGVAVLDPGWFHAAWTFTRAGFEHILDGVDHLLFLLCLVAPFRRVGWVLVGVITSFTVAHSITLIAAAYGVVPAGAWFPPLVEMLIALSILYMAVENLRPNLERRWVITFVFGLVHGFGLSFLLKAKLQFAGSHLLTSLVAFNVGIELGQLLVLALLIPLLVWVTRTARIADKALTWGLTIVVGHVAWHWLVERWDVFAKTEWPDTDELAALAAYGIPTLLALVAAAWFVRLRARTLMTGGETPSGSR